MTQKVARRDVLVGAAGVVGLLTLSRGRLVHAKESLVVVEWGANYIEAAKEVAAKQDWVDINWVLHSGGSAGIIPKIKATWPHVQYDVVTGWDASFSAMITEDWVESITVDDVPNLADVPADLIMKDSQGRWRDLPRTLTALYWGYREDIAPLKLENLEQLLDPRLKGQICFPDPVMSVNYQMVTIALAFGGDERNMEPAWDFMKKLAKSGNIGRVAHAEVDIPNSLTSGETSIAFGTPANWAQIGANFPVKELAKVKGVKGLKSGITTEGWVILKGGKKKEALEYLNFAMNPENNALFNARIGNVPTNRKAAVDRRFEHLVFSAEDLAEYAYIPDWGYLLGQVDASMKRWEQEIVPLLGG